MQIQGSWATTVNRAWDRDSDGFFSVAFTALLGIWTSSEDKLVNIEIDCVLLKSLNLLIL